MPRKLRVEFRTQESFRAEYAQNIAKGGLFVPTSRPIPLRTRVEVELLLAWDDQSIVLPGEVVHCIPPEMAQTGAQPGIAIQFLLDGDDLRGKLELLSGPVATHVDERIMGTGRRVAPRLRAHMPASVQLRDDWVSAHTRNISRSGALIQLPGEPPSMGSRLKLRIALPGASDAMEMPAQVARMVRTRGVSCVGVHFQVPEARQDDVADFVERVRSIEHTRRLGGINGPIATLGIRSVLTMFGSSAPEGMLTLSRGDEEGYILIDHGQLRAQVGLDSGRTALEELLAWQEGVFSFEGRVDETLIIGETISLAELTGEVDPQPEDALPAADRDEDLSLHDLESTIEVQGGESLPEAAEADLSLHDLDAGSEADDVDSEDSYAEEEEEDGYVSDGGHSLGDFVLDDDEADALEEQLRVEPPSVDGDARLVPTGEPDRSACGKTEEALLDLAAAGVTVAKAVDIIPEPEEQVLEALRNLLDEGFLRLE